MFAHDTDHKDSRPGLVNCCWYQCCCYFGDLFSLTVAEMEQFIRQRLQPLWFKRQSHDHRIHGGSAPRDDKRQSHGRRKAPGQRLVIARIGKVLLFGVTSSRTAVERRSSGDEMTRKGQCMFAKECPLIPLVRVVN
jgi:hypothetical protein